MVRNMTQGREWRQLLLFALPMMGAQLLQVAYSIADAVIVGNFVSAQPEKSCVKGGVARFTVSLSSAGYKVTDYTLLPLTIIREDDGRYTVKPKAP